MKSKFHLFRIFLLILILFIPMTVQASETENLDSNIPVGALEDGSALKGPEPVNVSANGTRIPLKIYRDPKGNIYIPIRDAESGQLFGQFNARVTWLVPMNTVVVGFPGGKDFRVKIGEKTGEYGGKKMEMKAPVVIVDDSPCIPLECMAMVYNLHISLNEVTHVLYMDPIITNIDFQDVKGKLQLVADGTAPLKFKTSLMTEPKRYVVDIEDAVLAPGLVDKDLRHPRVGSVFVSQDSVNPNRVRMIIPVGDMEIEMEDERKDGKKVTVHLFMPEVVAPVQGLKTERITRFRIKEMEDRVIFYVHASGPVQYEWRRLLPPDNRYFIDIPMAKVNEELGEKLKLGYISGIKITQLRKEPERVARITLNLEIPCVVNVAPDPDKPNIIKVEVLQKAIKNVKAEERQGFGITRHAVGGGIIICLDPGHGGGDPGACHNGLREKDITLDISFRLRKLLSKAGWNVVMTRATDRDVSFAGSSDSRELGDRVRVANGCRAQVFVSIHINASVNGSAGGTSTHYCKDIDFPLAQAIQNSLVPALGLGDNGVQNDGFFVIRHTYMPAALVECAFISNPREASLLSSSAFRQRIAEGIYNGIIAYARAKKLAGEAPPSDEDTEAVEVIREKKKEIDQEIHQGKPNVDPDFDER